MPTHLAGMQPGQQVFAHVKGVQAPQLAPGSPVIHPGGSVSPMIHHAMHPAMQQSPVLHQMQPRPSPTMQPGFAQQIPAWPGQVSSSPAVAQPPPSQLQPPAASHAPVSTPRTPTSAPTRSGEALCGVGLSLQIVLGVPIVRLVAEGQPAAATGKILPGDKLVEIRDAAKTGDKWRATKGLALEEVKGLVIGRAGTTVRMRFHRTKDPSGPGSLPAVQECEVSLIRAPRSPASSSPASATPSKPQPPPPEDQASQPAKPRADVTNTTERRMSESTGEGVEPNPNAFSFDIASVEAAVELVEKAEEWGKTNKMPPEQFQDLKKVLRHFATMPIHEENLSDHQTIDKGAFSYVQKAMLNGSPVAVKLTQASFTHEEEQLDEAFFQVLRSMMLELEVLAIVKHPSIVRLYGVVASFNPQKDLQLGLVFELCDTNLCKVLHEQGEKWGGMTRDQKFCIALDVAHGLEYLASQSVLHRDISSRNILLKASTSAPQRAFIADFGFARRISEEEGYTSMTISGSPPYMAPEIMTGSLLFLKTDVFSFGVLLWEIVSGNIPHADLMNDFQCIRDRVLRLHQKFSHPQSAEITDTNPLGPRALQCQTLAKKCCSFSLKDRPSMTDVVTALKQIREGTWSESAWEYSQAVMEGRLTRFYSVHNPEKLASVPAVCKDFWTNEEELNKRLRDKYNLDLTDFENLQGLDVGVSSED